MPPRPQLRDLPALEHRDPLAIDVDVEEHHVLPHASVDLVVVLSGAYQRTFQRRTQRVADARLMGVHLSPVEYQHRKGDRLIGVRLRAHGLMGFGLGGPARELVNQAAEVRDVLGPQFVELMRGLPDALPAQGIGRLERWFVEGVLRGGAAVQPLAWSLTR